MVEVSYVLQNDVYAGFLHTACEYDAVQDQMHCLELEDKV